MGLSDDYDRLAEQIGALATMVNALADHMQTLRLALSANMLKAKEAADAARVGVVAPGSEWCPKSGFVGPGMRLEWCAMVAGHLEPCSFEKLSLF